MDLFDKIRELSDRIPHMLDNLETEEATKLSLVVPFIQALGYNVSDPRDVIPEYPTGKGIKKAKKVDFTLLFDGKPAILIECKHHLADLKNSDQSYYSQLGHYFDAVKEASFGVLTNGLIYQFYSDLDDQTFIDKKPFFEFDLINLDNFALEELRKFSKSSFNLTSIRESALELKLKRETKDLLCDQLQNPDEELVRFVATKIYGLRGNLTKNWMKKFTAYTKWALNEVVNEKATPSPNTAVTSLALESGGLSGSGIEIISPANQANESYFIIRTILREVVRPDRVTIRNFKKSFGILLDDNQRKPICHLYFNDPQKYVVFFDTQTLEQVPIKNPADLCEHSERLKASVGRYEITTAR